MKKLSLLILAVVLAFQAAGVSARAETFDAVSKSFYALDENARGGKNPEEWRKMAQKFVDSSTGDKGDEALYMAALSFERAYRLSAVGADLKAALENYARVYNEYKTSVYADDALFRTARLGENSGDLDRARSYYKKVIELYPKGDMAPLARESIEKVGKTVEISSFRHWSGPVYTRIVLDLSGLSPFEVKALPADKASGRQSRVFVDIKRALISKNCETGKQIEDGLVSDVRISQNSKDTVRVVLDLADKADYRVFPLIDPYRLVIDAFKDFDEGDLIADLIGEAGKKAPAAPSGPGLLPARKPLASLAEGKGPDGGQEPQAAVSVDEKKPSKRNFRIVVDPGHGGKDPGALGPGGLKEKDVTLKIALEIKEKLEKNLNCEVKLTRTVDEDLSLARRTAIANSFGADIFVSIHANANTSKKARGIETFYLDRASDKAARRIAAIENSTSETGVIETEQILADALLNMKLPQSRRLAEAVQKEMLDRIVGDYGPVRDLGVRRAPFHVLTGAIMPAILLETAFISNPTEAGWLKDEKFRGIVADAVASAVGTYSKGY